jgi:hypothetical protein
MVKGAKCVCVVNPFFSHPSHRIYGDPLEMLIFNLSTLHLWGRTLAKYPQVRALAYADDGYIKAKMSVARQVLADVQHARGRST